MSRPSISVSPKILAASAIFALLAVVIVVNLRIWLGDSNPPRSDAVEMGGNELEPPDDLGQVARDVSAHQRGASAGLVAMGFNRGGGRDPFVFVSTQAPVWSGQDEPRRPRRIQDESLRCTAIFIGGGTHSALVAGRVVSEGDRMKSYRVGEITDEGVNLFAGGQKKFLPLETKRKSGAVGAPIALGH